MLKEGDFLRTGKLLTRGASILLTMVLLFIVSSCAAAAPRAESIRIAGLKGATSIGLVQLMDQSEQKKTQNTYEFGIYATADEVTPKLIQGQLDIAAVPANLASILYNNTKGEVVLLAVNTLGVLYIVETGESIQSLSDLKGKTIYASGKGSSPEYGLRYLLQSEGLDPDSDVTIEWKSEPTEIVAALAATPGSVAMLPQPYVTIAQGKVDGLRVALDLDEIWQETTPDSLMVTGVLVVRKAFAEAYPEQLSAFLSEYKASTDFANAYAAETGLLSEKFGLFPAAVAEKAIPDLNITYIAGEQMRPAMEGYLRVLFEQNPKSVGGQLPGDEFYYAVPSKN